MSVQYTVPVPEVVAEGCGYTADYTRVVGQEMLAYARGSYRSALSGNVPVRTGNLAASAFVSGTSTDINVGFSISYAQYVPAADSAASSFASTIESFGESRANFYEAVASSEVENTCIELDDDFHLYRRVRLVPALLRRRARKRVRTRKTKYSSFKSSVVRATTKRMVLRTIRRIILKF